MRRAKEKRGVGWTGFAVRNTRAVRNVADCSFGYSKRRDNLGSRRSAENSGSLKGVKESEQRENSRASGTRGCPRTYALPAVLANTSAHRA